MNRFLTPAFLALCFLWICAPAQAQGEPTQPNIVHIFVDDLGFGSVGFNGQQLIQTPNLDALAAGGMNFTNAYAAPICAPSRGMLMSGFHNGHSRIDRNQDIGGDVFAPDDVTVADTLLTAGYHTSVFGKHGFGGTGGTNAQSHGQGTNPQVNGPNSVPSAMGYETFYGYLDHSRAHNYYPSSLWESTELGVMPVEVLTGNTPGDPYVAFAHQLVTDRAADYLSQRAQAQNAGVTDAFYSQINFTIPHANVGDVAFTGTNRYAHEPWTQNQRNYAELISRMDDSVGQILDTLRDPNGDGDTSDSVLDKTLILFTSDNGPTRQSTNLDTINFFDAAGDYRGTKRDLYEGGIHVPAVAYWEGTIQPGSTSDRYTDLADFMPTAAELAGIDAPVGTDGVSIAPLLTGQGIQRQRDYLIFEHHEGGGEQQNSQRSIWAVVHTNGYKLIRHNSGTDELFNLNTDPDESNPLNLGVGGHQAIYDELLAIALAEGVESDLSNTNGYVVSYRTWTGDAGNGQVSDAGNWSGSGAPEGTWSAVIDNPTANARDTNVVGNIQTLGLEVRGSGATQTVTVANGATLTGRNEVRIAGGGHVHLDGGRLNTVRWVDVYEGGELSGGGEVTGDVYAMGRVAPGHAEQVAANGPEGVDTGLVTAVVFDFTGVQDDSPLQATTTLSQYLQLAPGLSYGPGTSPRGTSDAGDEFNMRGFTADSLAQAITSDDYVGYTIAPVSGIEVQLGTASFNVWRNGVNAATDYAILTSADGFTAGQALATQTLNQIGINDGSTLQGASSAEWTSAPIEVRLYGWNANGDGNTHLNAASLTASFRSAPGGTVSPQGVLTIDGNYFHLKSATLGIDLAGTDNSVLNAPEYDQLVVHGTAQLAGTLEVALGDGYDPDAGDSFVVIDAEQYAGAFDDVLLPELLAGRFWDLSELDTAGTLHVTDQLRGDLDGDGFIGLGDLDVLLANWGQTTSTGDVSGDGIVSTADLDIVRANWGLGTAPAGNVPEPGSAAALAIGGLLLTRHSR